MSKNKLRRPYDPMKALRPETSWLIHNFPAVLKNRFAAYCKASGTTMKDYLEYLLSKELREAGVDVPLIHGNNKFVKELLEESES